MNQNPPPPPLPPVTPTPEHIKPTPQWTAVTRRSVGRQPPSHINMHYHATPCVVIGPQPILFLLCTILRMCASGCAATEDRCINALNSVSVSLTIQSIRNTNMNERSRGRHLLHGHGTFSTSKVGGWRLVAVGGWWRLGAVLKGCPKQKNLGLLKDSPSKANHRVALCLRGPGRPGL